MQTKNRDTLVSFPLNAVTSEQIDAYRKLYAEDRKSRGKKPGVKEHALVSEDETVLALARAVGDHRVKKVGVIETKRPY
ncbi:MAG: hypothetical protein LBD68_02395 [Zoogloeaceae bacterium]|nr:hypothetical protein [Zoogloeaceae bacterium]